MCEKKNTSDFLLLLKNTQDFLLDRSADPETIPSMIERLRKAHDEWDMEVSAENSELLLSMHSTVLFVVSELHRRYLDWKEVKHTRELIGSRLEEYQKILKDYGTKQQRGVDQLVELKCRIRNMDYDDRLIGRFERLCSYFRATDISTFHEEWSSTKNRLWVLESEWEDEFKLFGQSVAEIQKDLNHYGRSISDLIKTSDAGSLEDGLRDIEEKIEELGNHDVVDSELIEHLKNGLKRCKESLADKIELLKKQEESKLRESHEAAVAKIEELENSIANDSQNLRKELMEQFASQAQQMENRISETNEKMDYLNRKLGHFNSSFNGKFNSLEEQFDSMQLDKKIEAINIQKNSGEDLNQFLAKIGEKFNEQQMEMKLRAEWLDRKMEKMMEMMKKKGEKSSSAEERRS